MKTELFNCVICKKPFERNTKKQCHYGSRSKGVRKVGCKTCSKKCSNKYCYRIK